MLNTNHTPLLVIQHFQETQLSHYVQLQRVSGKYMTRGRDKYAVGESMFNTSPWMFMYSHY